MRRPARDCELFAAYYAGTPPVASYGYDADERATADAVREVLRHGRRTQDERALWTWATTVLDGADRTASEARAA